jgi:hypothetical protein
MRRAREYGEPYDALRRSCEELALSLHTFAWTPAMRKAGMRRRGAYLIRPEASSVSRSATAIQSASARIANGTALRHSANGHQSPEASRTRAVTIALIAMDLCAEVVFRGTRSHSTTCFATSDIPSDHDRVSPTSICRLQKVQVKEAFRSLVTQRPYYRADGWKINVAPGGNKDRRPVRSSR